MTAEGLRASDAVPVVDVPCGHEHWNAVNAALGCIHSDHGAWPPPLVDHFTGVRLVDGVPTRYVPAKR